MLYEILCLLIAAFAVYGFYRAVRQFLFDGVSGEIKTVPALRFTVSSSEEETEEQLEILQLRTDAMGNEPPVLLIDCPLRGEVLRRLANGGTEIYLSYEEYYEKRNQAPLR